MTNKIIKLIVATIAVAAFGWMSMAQSADVVYVAQMPDSLNVIGNSGNSVTSSAFKLFEPNAGIGSKVPDSAYAAIVYGLLTTGSGADTTDINLWLDVGYNYDGTIVWRDSAIVLGSITDRVYTSSTSDERFYANASIGFGNNNVSVLGVTSGFAPWARVRAKANSAGNDSTVLRQVKLYLTANTK